MPDWFAIFSRTDSERSGLMFYRRCRELDNLDLPSADINMVSWM